MQLSKFIFIGVICCFVLHKSNAQIFVGQNKKRITDFFDCKNAAKIKDSTIKIDKETFTIIQTDTTTNSLTASDFAFHFTNRGICDFETRVFKTATFLQNSLKEILNIEKMRWVKTSDTTYFSAYAQKLYIRVQAEPKFSYTITKINVSKLKYSFLLGKITQEEYEEELSNDYERRSKKANPIFNNF